MEQRFKIQEQQAKKIGPFYFDYDDDIEAEVLQPKQVYDDLMALDEILNRNQGDKNAQAFMRRKPKKKNNATTRRN